MPQRRPTKAQVQEQLSQERESRLLLEEALAELELGLEDANWVRDSVAVQREFSRDGLQRLAYRCRLAYLKDPLIRNGVNIQAHYVWGQGAELRAKNAQVNDVVQTFLDDRQNGKTLTGHAAHMKGERQLQTEGNIFLALWTNPNTGFVRVRKLPLEQVRKIHTNPEDRDEVWYYERRWTERQPDAFEDLTGLPTPRTVLHPDWLHRPEQRPAQLNGMDVLWDAPVYHVKVGDLEGMQFGVPEVFAALDWANAVKRDLEDYATIRRALARFAWNTKVGGGAAAVKRTRDKLATTLDPAGNVGFDTNPPPTTGSMFVSAPGVSLEPIKTAGAAGRPDDSRYLWLQVGAALGIPHTMLAGDAEGGNWATAKTLDRPTELKMTDRQTLWADIFTDVLNYVIDMAVLAPSGPLDGFTEVDPVTGQEVIRLGPDPEAQPDEAGQQPEMDRGIVAKFPNILERDTFEAVRAVAYAATLGNLTGYPAGTVPAVDAIKLIPRKVLSGILLSHLDVADADEILETMYPEDGQGEGGPDDVLLPGAGGGPGDQQVVEALAGVRAAAEKMLEGNGNGHHGTRTEVETTEDGRVVITEQPA